MLGAGIEFKASPIKKCPGVRGSKSCGSLEIGDIGLLFMQASIWVRIVYICSKMNSLTIFSGDVSFI